MPKTERSYPMTVKHRTGVVHIARRANGWFALRWMEKGTMRRTTRTTEEKAIEWAQVKAEKLHLATGEQWVDPLRAQITEEMGKVAQLVRMEMWQLLEDVRAAVKVLGGQATLTAAAEWYASHGPLKVEKATLAEAVERFLINYQDKGTTHTTFATELRGMVKARPDVVRLLDVTPELLEAWVRRKTAAGTTTGRTAIGVAPAERTVKNRLTTWVTFLNRCRDWRLLPEGKHAGDRAWKPRKLADAGREILTTQQGAKLLTVVRQHEPKLEAFLLIAGWLGLRPSECQRLRWGAFDWAGGYLHLDVETAGKTSQERYVPMDPRVAARLREIFVAGGEKETARACGWRSREFLSVLARGHGVVERWPSDVLRHSFCSYRLALTQNRAKVAEEAGNSPTIIGKHYRRPLPESAGAQWWDILGDVPATGDVPAEEGAG
jgi:integrase